MDKKSSHILNASSNLLGFCLVILTSLKISKIGHSAYIDGAAALASLLLVASCLFSFLSIRGHHQSRIDKYEKIADYFFLGALTCISLTVIIVGLDFIRH